MALSTVNPFIKSFEVKLYFIVFVLFSVFMAALIYNTSLDNIIAEEAYRSPNTLLNYEARTGALEEEPIFAE